MNATLTECVEMDLMCGDTCDACRGNQSKRKPFGDGASKEFVFIEALENVLVFLGAVGDNRGELCPSAHLRLHWNVT